MDMNSRGQPATNPALDVANIDLADAAQRAFPLPEKREPVFQVVIKQSVLNDIRQHGQTTPEVEICGVVVGKLYRDDKGPFLYLESSIRGNFAQGQVAQVTFTSETWAHIHQELEEKSPDLRIAGWYHTHPGFGIFLSAMDKFIHKNFFSVPWQVAYVYDPRSGEDGMFLWKSGEPADLSFLIEDDAVPIVPKFADNPAPPAHPTEILPVPAAPDELSVLRQRLALLERNQFWNTVIFGLIIIIQIVTLFLIYQRNHGSAVSSTAPTSQRR